MARDDPDDIMTAQVVSASQLPATYRRDFELLIAKTLWIVFELSFEKAAETSRDFMSEAQSEMDGSQLLYIYHQSPLQIAAGLAEASGRELTDDEIDRYRQIIQVTEQSKTERPTDFELRMG